MNNFDLHRKAMDFVRQKLEEQRWIVEEIVSGKDDYLQINRPESYKTYRIKVKALSQEAPVPFHTRSPDSMKADFFVICRKMEAENPEVFTASKKEVVDATHKHGSDYWLETEHYEKFERGIAMLGRLRPF